MLVQARLYPDMFPLARQVQIATDTTKGCAAHIAGETHLTWRIENGILVSKITKVSDPSYGHVGDVLKAKIISLTQDRMVLHSLDDGTTYSRVRSTRCLAPKLQVI